MLIEVRPVRQLRAEPRVDLAAALGPLVETLVADDAIDLAQVRVVCEWIQYRGNFREVVEVHVAFPRPAVAVNTGGSFLVIDSPYPAGPPHR